LILHLLR